jgi:hypothetical protein
MTDPFADAYDRLDRLHRQWPMPTTCTQCERHGTTAADRICGPCAYERRLRQIWSA